MISPHSTETIGGLAGHLALVLNDANRTYLFSTVGRPVGSGIAWQLTQDVGQYKAGAIVSRAELERALRGNYGQTVVEGGGFENVEKAKGL